MFEIMRLKMKINKCVIKCEEDIEKLHKIMEEFNIEKYDIDYDIAYVSCGLDVYYYALTYIYDGEVYLITGTFESD